MMNTNLSVLPKCTLENIVTRYHNLVYLFNMQYDFSIFCLDKLKYTLILFIYSYKN